MSLDVTWLGHATVVLDLDGVRLVADPLLRRNAGLLVRRGERPSEQAWTGADAVLLSHLHHDHAELASLRLLGDVPVITAPANAAWVTRRGLNGVGPDEDQWTAVGGAEVTVRLTPAVHDARPMPHRPNAASGHLVRGPSGIVWLAGDTELFDGMEDLAHLAGGPIDLALVPIGGWGPRLSPGHMGPVEAAIACRRVGARHAIPVHWKTLHIPAGQVWPAGWMDAGGPAFAAALAQEAPHCRGIALNVGDSVSVAAPAA
jgi:L-ascorbate metabolism protein UlaG (beta-lactamase superfamily)